MGSFLTISTLIQCFECEWFCKFSTTEKQVYLSHGVCVMIYLS